MTSLELSIKAIAYECVECGATEPCVLCDINVDEHELLPTYCPYDGSTLAKWVERKDAGVSP